MKKGFVRFLTFCAVAAAVFYAARVLGVDLRFWNSAKATAPPPIPTELYGETEEKIAELIIDVLSEENPNEVTKDALTRIKDNLSAIPQEYIDLLFRNPETAEFVAGYLDYRPSSRLIIDVAAEVRDAHGAPCYFAQWDKRWGYIDYGKSGSPIAISGCGPTALAIVAAGLTGNADINPKAVADYAYSKGYYVEGTGTAWALMSEGCEYFGLKSKEVPLDENVIKAALRAGIPIIASMRAGTFTTGGHFIVLRGVDENGDILIYDPNSPVKSAQAWPFSVFESEARNFWKFEIE